MIWTSALVVPRHFHHMWSTHCLWSHKYSEMSSAMLLPRRSRHDPACRGACASKRKCLCCMFGAEFDSQVATSDHPSAFKDPAGTVSLSIAIDQGHMTAAISAQPPRPCLQGTLCSDTEMLFFHHNPTRNHGPNSRTGSPSSNYGSLFSSARNQGEINPSSTMRP